MDVPRAKLHGLFQQHAGIVQLPFGDVVASVDSADGGQGQRFRPQSSEQNRGIFAADRRHVVPPQRALKIDRQARAADAYLAPKRIERAVDGRDRVDPHVAAAGRVDEPDREP
jgi:hypothetical protein